MSLPRTPSMRLDGKRALVTGATSGIGEGCAVALAEAGAHGHVLDDVDRSRQGADAQDNGQRWLFLELNQSHEHIARCKPRDQR